VRSKIGVAAEPTLQQRRRRREHEVRQSNGCGQESQYSERRHRILAWLPKRRWNNGQREAAQRQQEYVEGDLAPFAQLCEPVCIGITEQQHELEEHQTDRPDTRGTAEPWQDLFGQYGLDQKQQE
jgi:hypothetical protein